MYMVSMNGLPTLRVNFIWVFLVVAIALLSGIFFYFDMGFDGFKRVHGGHGQIALPTFKKTRGNGGRVTVL